MAISYTTQAIVIKRRDHGEADRFVTLFTEDHGKKTVLAKGVRKINSKRLGSLEVGSQLEVMIIERQGADVLGQTNIIDSFAQIKNDLNGITQLYQLLEIVDILTREDQDLPEVYELLLHTLKTLTQTSVRKPILLDTCHTLLHLLGYAPPKKLDEYALKQYIESIAERHLKSKEFLTTK